MPFLFAGLASLAFGVGDFLGGFATRRAAAASVVTSSQVVGGLGIVIAAPLLDPVPGAVDFWWGAAAGAAGAVGITMLYHGLATMRIGIVAPTTAVVGTTTPVLFGVITGERPSALAWIGIAVAIVAIVAIASPPDEQAGGGVGGLRAVALSVATGLAFGLFGIFISRTGADSGLWPLVSARAASVGIVATAALAMRQPLIPARARGYAAGAGALDMVANVLFLLAVRRELLSLVVVIMALAPGATIALARVVLHERFGRAQMAGLALGATGIVMIVLG